MNTKSHGTPAVFVFVLFILLSCVGWTQLVPEPSPIVTLDLDWQIVVNNGVTVPGDESSRTFNSYNQPSINMDKLVVFRARSKGGESTGEPAHGIWTRDMSDPSSALETVLDRETLVPEPNILNSTFIEPPSFPRIGMTSNMIATRANHQNVWEYVEIIDGAEVRTPGGTTGIYTNPFGSLITGASNLGAMPSLGFFAEPTSGVKFDVFPGAPAVAGNSTIVFKGNFTVPDPNNPDGVSKTGVYYRTLTDQPIMADPGTGSTPLGPAGGMNPVVLIANSNMLIPGTKIPFGSTAPPSAAGTNAVFAGFDNEDNPNAGGIFVARLAPDQKLKQAVVKIGGAVPGESGAKFTKIGEGLSYDGRFIAFWGAWGTETKALKLQCPTDGNAARIAFCLDHYPNGFETTVPLHQGIFVYDTYDGNAWAVAKTGTDFSDFVYWNFSGLVPGTGESDETGEPARWRSASFVAVSGFVDGSLSDATFHVAFKARKGEVVNGAYVNPTDGIYLTKVGPGNKRITAAIVETGMDGTIIDPAATYIDEETSTTTNLPITAMGIERDGFRGNSMAINVTMGTEEAGWSGIYLTTVPQEF